MAERHELASPSGGPRSHADPAHQHTAAAAASPSDVWSPSNGSVAPAPTHGAAAPGSSIQSGSGSRAGDAPDGEAAAASAPSSSRWCIPPPLRDSTASFLSCLGGSSGGEDGAVGSIAKPAPPPPVAPITPQQRRLLHAILHADIDALLTQFDRVDWNFSHLVVGRTAVQSPLGLLLRPELNYGNLSRMTRASQRRVIEHALSLDQAYTPRLDSMDHAAPFMRQTMSMHVIQAVYQGRTDLFELLYHTSIERQRQGTGVAFDLRERFFTNSSRITLLHMAAHDGQLEMARWILRHWAEEAERDPSNPLNEEFHAGVLDGLGQTPLFWTFARGCVSVELARFLVEECGQDLFHVFELHTRELGPDGMPLKRVTVAEKRDADGNVIVPQQLSKPSEPYFAGYASAFSLAIQLAPDFVEEQLRLKTENMGTRFQKQIVKFDFQGITLRTAQVEMIQQRVDELNSRRSEMAGASHGGKLLEGNKFLEDANKQLRDFFTQAALGGEAGPSHGGGGGSDGSNGAVGFSNHAAGLELAFDRSTGSVDISELRFLSQEPQGDRPIKERWDNFYFDQQPCSALELMVQHRRRRLLLTPVMREVSDRLWNEMKEEYWAMAACYALFGLLFAINTALWPRTAQLLGSNIPTPLPSGTAQATWVSWFLVNNISCFLLVFVMLAFYCKTAYEGPYRRPALRSLRSVTDTLRTVARNVAWTFRSSSARIDLALLLCFLIVEALQWSLVCHVAHFASQSACSSTSLTAAVNAHHVSALAWFSSALHLLLGLKLLELLSVFAWAGPLFSTLVGMMRDVGNFMGLFGVGFAAFACASWVVLKDVYDDVDPSLGLGGPSAAAAAAAAAGQSAPQAHYTYEGALADVLLWVFMSFDFAQFSSTPVPGVSALGRVLLLVFLLLMSLIMLNLMIAMFSNTYADVVKEAVGEAALRRAAWACQLLRMAGDQSASSRSFVSAMGVVNNCGIDKDTAHDSDGSVNAEAGDAAGGGGSTSGGGNWAETVNDHFMAMRFTLQTLKAEIATIKAQQAERASADKQLAAHSSMRQQQQQQQQQADAANM